MKKGIKRVLSITMAVALSLSVSLLGVSAATSYTPPSQGMTADNSKYLSGATAAANTVVLSVLGINVTSTDGAGIYTARGNTDSWGTDSSNLGIFGSDINDSPDPYVYNFFYNLYSTQSGGTVYSVDDYSKWTATPYTLVSGTNKAGPTGSAKGTVTISVNGEDKTCNPAFFYEPDILLGAATDGYSEELSNYQRDYNADYNPTIFLGYGMGMGQYAAGGIRSDGLGLEYNMFDMSAGVVRLGQRVEALADEIGKQNRYDNGAYEIGVNYDKYDRGLYYYAQSLFADGSLTKINYASGASFDADTSRWAVTKGTGRQAQYASGIGNDIFDMLENGYQFSDGTVIEASEITSTGGGPGGRPGGGSSTTTGYYLTTAQMIEILNNSGSDDATGVIIGNVTSANDWAELSHAGIRCLYNLPTCVYGMTMQTVENGMGIPFYLAYFYYNQNEKLNPGNFIYYWMENFYHVTDNAKMETVVGNMLGSSDLPAGYGGAAIASYNADEIEEMIEDGIDYYENTLVPQYESEGVASDSALYWDTLDTSVGIGSDIQETNKNYDVTVTDTGTQDEFGNKLYTFTYTEKNSGGSGESGGSGGGVVPSVFTITVSGAENGTVTASAEKAAKGSTVKLTVTPSEGYETDAVSVKYANNDDVKVETGSDGSYSFTMPGSKVTVNATFKKVETTPVEPQPSDPTPPSAASKFKDLDANAWYSDAVDYVVNNNLFNGTSDTSFEPNGTMTRAMFVTVLSRLEGIDASKYTGTDFTDVNTGQWYSSAIQWASKNNIVGGIGDGKFDPNGNVSREQMATIMYRYANYKNISTSNVDATKFNAFSDSGSVSSWAVDAVKWAVDKGIINGMGDGTIAPQGISTRAQVAQIVKNYTDKIAA